MRGSWQQVVISDVAELVRGVTYSKEDSRDTPAEGFSPVLRATNIQNSRLVLESDLVYVPSGNVSPTQCLRAGDIVMATSSGSKHLVGKSALMRTNWVGSFGAFCAALRAKPNIEPRYLSAFLQSPAYWKQVTKKALGVNINNLRRGDIETLALPLPELDEQREIVAEIEKQFSRLDEAVANLQRVKANLKRYKASVLKDAVEGRLVPLESELARREGRSFETGEQLLEKIREKRRTAVKGKRRDLVEAEVCSLADAPEGWLWTTCDAAIDEIDAGASFKCVEQPPRANEIGVLKVSAVSWGTFNEEESKTCVDVNRIEESYLVKPGDFLFSRANTIELVGACVIVGTVRKQLMLSDKTLRFKVSDCVLPNWLLICLRTKFGRSEIEKLSTGNQESMRNIGQERIRQIRVPLPPLREQERIVVEVERRLSLVRGVEVEVDTNLKRAQALRQATLSRAFQQYSSSPRQGVTRIL